MTEAEMKELMNAPPNFRFATLFRLSILPAANYTARRPFSLSTRSGRV